MKDLNNYINEKYHKDVLSAETFLDKNDLEKTFLHLIDDASYNLEKDFGISITPQETAEIICKAMDKYKNFK